MTNKYRPHLLVLPEDDANRQIADGFALHPAIAARRMQVLTPADGWSKVLESFERNHLSDLRRFPERRIVLLIDFDEAADRLGNAKQRVPGELQDRVFILGARKEPQDIRHALPSLSFEDIGQALAEDCRTNTRTLWGHDELACNTGELDRLNAAVKPWLFSDPRATNE